jgi:hypothetical protein
VNDVIPENGSVIVVKRELLYPKVVVRPLRSTDVVSSPPELKFCWVPSVKVRVYVLLELSVRVEKSPAGLV